MSSLDGVRSMHGDVLDCSPTDDESKARLVDELKNRGNLAFKAKRLDEAILMYTEALKHNPTLHTILGNRSMVHLNKGSLEEALEDAEECIRLDPKWMKGYYRKGSALEKMKKWGQAYDALKVASEAAPKDLKLKERVDKMYKKACQQLEKGEVSPTASKSSSSSASKGKTKTSTSSSKKASTGKSETVVDKDDDDDTAGNMRGYKTLANGHKTSFFHTEISDEAKALLAAQGGPKQLDAAEVQRMEAAERSTKKEGEGSAWNKANTFEERDMAKWAKERIHALLEAIEATLPGDQGSLKVKKLKDYEGDASMPIIRGKKRHIFDLSFTAEWEAKLGGGKKLKGEMYMPDVSSDGDDTFEMEFKVKGEASDENRALVKSNLEGAIGEALSSFVAEFNAR